MLTFFYQCIVTNIDSAEWNRTSNASFYPATTPSMDTYQQQQQYQQSAFDYGQQNYDENRQRDSRPQSRSNSRAGSRSNSRPSSRPMSRASSQQRFYDEPNEYQQQPRSLSRNDSQRSLTEYAPQRQPDPLITTRIEESFVEPQMESMRKPSVTFKGEEYEQQSQNIQQVVEQRNPLYSSLQQQPQQYEDQSIYQPQPIEYDYGQQNMGYTYDQQQYEQPVVDQSGYYQPESRRQSPEQEYRSYVEPQTPKRSSPPKTPTREQSREEIAKIVQQRQQSREQLYDGDEIPQSKAALSSKQQSRDNLSELVDKSPSPPASQSMSPIATAAPTASITRAPLSTNVTKQMAPPSPKRSNANLSRNSTKGGAEQKVGRNTLGEATGAGRKSDTMQKQPPKVSNIRGKK